MRAGRTALPAGKEVMYAVLALAVAGAVNAFDTLVLNANETGLTNYVSCVNAGTLALDVSELGGWFYNDAAEPCWDGCDSILTFHRAGWCKENPEHADMDCMCGVSDDWEDWVDGPPEY
jgi:hypothetical protein